MTASPTPPTFTITLHGALAPELLATLTQLVACLRPLLSSVTSFPSDAPAPDGSTASAAPAAGGAPATARVDVSSLTLPAAATQTPPPVSSKAGKRGRGKKQTWCTEARAAVIRELWPTAATTPDIVARVSALPGDPVPSPAYEYIAKRAFLLGVKRPPDAYNPFRRATVASQPDPVAPDAEPVDSAQAADDDIPPERVVTPPPAPDAPPSDASLAARARVVTKPLPRWTPDRVTLLKREYGTLPEDTVLAHLQALPGAELNLTWMHGYASGLGLKLPTAAVPAVTQRRAASREAIEGWCFGRGWRFDKFDIDAINSRCAGVGHPGFTVIEPQRRGAAA